MKLYRLTAQTLAACAATSGFLLLDACEASRSGEPTGEGGASNQAAFMLGTRIWDDTTVTSYFHLVASLDADTKVDPSRSLEVPGAAKLYASPDGSWLAVGAGDEPTLTRYTVANGSFQAEARLSLQPYGVQSLWDTLYIISPTKMYYPDRQGQQLIIIDPTAMTIDGTIPLPQTAREGYLSLYGYSAIQRQDQLLFSVAWFDWESGDSVLPETGLVVLDTASDSVVRFDTDARCGGITQAITLESGDTYFASSALAAAAHRLGRLSTGPCALRVLGGGTGFDADYMASLGDLVGAELVGEPVPAGGNSLFLRVFEEAAGSIEATHATWDLTSQAVWTWRRWDVAAGAVSPADSLAPSTADVLWFQADGHVYGSETAEDYSSTTLIDLTAEGGPKRALTVPGFLHGLAPLRP